MEICINPAVQVVISYKAALVDTFIEVADAIEDRFPDLQVDGTEEELKDCSFTIKGNDGQLIYSAGENEFTAEAIVKVLESINID